MVVKVKSKRHKKVPHKQNLNLKIIKTVSKQLNLRIKKKHLETNKMDIDSLEINHK